MERLLKFLDMCVPSYDIKVDVDEELRIDVPLPSNDKDYFAMERYELAVLSYAVRNMTHDSTAHLYITTSDKSQMGFVIFYDDNVNVVVQQIDGIYEVVDLVDEIKLALNSALH